VVALSFAVMALLLHPVAAARPAGANPACARPGVALALAAARGASVALALVVTTAAFTGPQSPTGNFAAVFVWVLWWVGLAFVQALIGDVWSLLNPWRTLARLLGGVRGRRATVADGPAPRRYPAALAYWPAVLGFLAFAWLELVSDLGEHPATLGLLIVTYTVVTLTAAVAFGDAWFERGDPFSVVFGILARFAPLRLDPAGGAPRLRLPGRGLLVDAPVPPSLMVLVIALLATVSFDGFVETPPWAALLEWITRSETLRAPLLALQGAGVNLLALIKTVGLLAAVVLFVLAYLLFAWLVDRCSGAPRGLADSAGRYVLTLVPIAIGYHLAHYLSYLLIAGQLAIPLASDPFGLGWDLFGSGGYSIDIAIVDARFVWFTAVLTVVAGHVIAVWLAHAGALALYRQRRRAIRSQVPMLALMVSYTMTSLWILSQPIVEV
jgi:hypothetical protein